MKDKEDWGPADYYADAEAKIGIIVLSIIIIVTIYIWLFT